MALDTGVVVSALLFAKGALSWIRLGWTQRDFQPLVSRETTEELIRVLSYPKFQLAPEEVDAVLAAYLPYAEVVRAGARPREALPRCADPDDQKFLELADAGDAEVLVTGDRHLLSLAGQTRFKILEPASFRDLVRAQ